MREILVITTGGTIDKVYFDAKSDFEVGRSVVEELLREAHVGIGYTIVELMRKDSLELTDEDREAVRAAIEVRAAAASEESESTESDSQLRVVVTHGTDTMTDTAKAIAATVASINATVVLTGALSPARFAHSDATFNVGMAFATAQTAASGVYIVMNGQVFDGLAVRKDRANNQFVSL